MSHILYDPDMYEVVSTSTQCTCNGKCNGMCCGSASMSMRLRAPEDLARIKSERARREEDEILTKAEIIKARRYAERGLDDDGRPKAIFGGWV